MHRPLSPLVGDIDQHRRSCYRRGDHHYYPHHASSVLQLKGQKQCIMKRSAFRLKFFSRTSFDSSDIGADYDSVVSKRVGVVARFHQSLDTLSNWHGTNNRLDCLDKPGTSKFNTIDFNCYLTVRLQDLKAYSTQNRKVKKTYSVCVCSQRTERFAHLCRTQALHAVNL